MNYKMYGHAFCNVDTATVKNHVLAVGMYGHTICNVDTAYNHIGKIDV